MFRKQPRIKQISSTSSGDFLFVFGLGADGKAYIWHSDKCVWLLHKQVSPEQAEKNLKAQNG